jgi:hypothetical protein
VTETQTDSAGIRADRREAELATCVMSVSRRKRKTAGGSERGPHGGNSVESPVSEVEAEPTRECETNALFTPHTRPFDLDGDGRCQRGYVSADK